MAGAAIGVSHIVQSTRAGASFGFSLVGLILLANFLKYPFFEFGHRYAAATGNNLLNGYRSMGQGYLVGFFILNLLTSIGTMAGVTYVTGALAYNLVGGWGSVNLWCGITLLVCAGILVIGHYRFLDATMKILMVLLLLATLTAFLVALQKGGGRVPVDKLDSSSAFDLTTLPFLIALMGWMPAPVETSVWQSIWVQEKNRELNENISWRMAQIDFNIGYFATAILAVIFLSLGALVMFGSDVEFSNSGGVFASQVVSLYTQNLGEWSKPLIGFAAFSTMFSTTLTCFDAYPRSLTAAGEILWRFSVEQKKKFYKLFLLWAGLGGLLVIVFFVTNLKTLIDFVTIAAFLTAPIFALLNYKLIFSSRMPKALAPGPWMKGLCWVGLAYLFGFSFLFVFTIF